MAFLYILFSASLNKYYIGSTERTIEDRLKKHLSKHKGFTATAKDWKLVHSELFDDKLQALSREKQIKAWKSRLKIEELIRQNC